MPEAATLQRPEGRILTQLCERVAEHYQRRGTPDRDFATALPWLSFVRMSEPTVLNRGMLQPSMCMVLQGRKKMLIGDNVTEYGPGSYSLAAADRLAVTARGNARETLAAGCYQAPPDIRHAARLRQ